MKMLSLFTVLTQKVIFEAYLFYTSYRSYDIVSSAKLQKGQSIWLGIYIPWLMNCVKKKESE